ncbi:MAG: ATP-sensitive inward rectifier potassium channel 10 [Deltaproteobacteria bacterium]|nr:ATP-sensitive inward rectifier potassium channel 10 [Deltaproteobacteria bacterium]
MRHDDPVKREQTGLIHPHPFGDLYHVLLTASWPRLVLIVAACYVVGNSLFALGYLLNPGGIDHTRAGSFRDAFFFSIQTMATIGYGQMVPHSLFANILVTLEALVGVLGFALMTGLVFAKFSRPSARVLFSRVAVITQWDGIPSLLFRMANARGNQIVEAQIHLVLAREEITPEGESFRRLHDLALIRSQHALFTLTWTAVHPITAQSPLAGVTPASLAAADTEIIVSLIGFDETFSQTVHARYAYTARDIVWGARFVDVLSRLPNGQRRIDYTRFHDVVRSDSAIEEWTDTHG